jgi:hypothetical protein
MPINAKQDLTWVKGFFFFKKKHFLKLGFKGLITSQRQFGILLNVENNFKKNYFIFFSISSINV